MGEYAVDLVGWIDRLPEGGDVHVGLHGGIECVDPNLRFERGVRLLAVELDVELCHREEVLVDDIIVRRVNHHCRGGVAERAGVDEIDLAAVGLLGRGAEHRYANAELVGKGSHGDAGSDRGRGDHVVAAGVANLGEGVDFAADHHLGT